MKNIPGKMIFLRHKTTFLLIGFVLIVKLILFLWPLYDPATVAYSGGDWLNIWDHWDSGVYKIIAQSSYAFENMMKLDTWAFLSHFLPLYPLAMAITSGMLHVSLTYAGIIISLLSIVGASVLLYKLTYLECGSEKIAWLSVIFLNLYPTSYFTISVYSESLFLCLSIGSFYYLKQARYFLSGLFACGSVLTRFVGVALMPVYALYFLQKYRRSHLDMKTLYPFLGALIGLVVYLLVNKFYYGDYLYFMTEKLSYGASKQLIWPFQETYSDIGILFWNWNFVDQSFMMHRGWNAIFTLIAIIIIMSGFKKIHWMYSMYALGMIFIFGSLSAGISNARYTLVVFPIFMVLGFMKNSILLVYALALSSFLLIYFTGIYVSGNWAF